MIMQKLIKAVKLLVNDEYCRASQMYGPVHYADHQSVAVLAEEVEEARDEISTVIEKTQAFWKLVKSDAPNADKLKVLRGIKLSAVLAACEAIQVAAMAYKAEKTINHRGEQ